MAWPVAAQSPPLYGPVDGRIIYPPASAIAPHTAVRDVAPVSAVDYAISATFHNPYGAITSGMFDRSFSTPDAYARAVSRAYIAREIQRGPVEVCTGAGEYNDVEVAVDGPGGTLSVNGEEVAALDLHDLVDEGEVSVLTAMSVPPQQGAVTRYENLTVTPLPAKPSNLSNPES